MESLFSTHDVHPSQRFDYWHDVACKNIVEHESQPESRIHFNARIETGWLADIGLVLFENSSMLVKRTAKQVSRARTSHLFVCRQIEGWLALEQAGSESRLESGEVTLLDPMLPYEGRFSSGSKLLVLKVPRAELEARVGSTRAMLARTLQPLAAEISLTSAFLLMLPEYAGRMNAAAEQVTKNQTLDLLAMALAKAMERQSPRVSSAKMSALFNVRAAIEAGLTDPHLSPEAVAAAARLSVRYANAVLAELDTSIVRLIQERRLARCRKALEDPAQDHRSVSDIAFGWGFSDMTHFGRRFKQEFGMLPSEYRRSRRTSDPCSHSA
jgi:AraC family transcriptional regulator, positive regulator of tynA and feaB